MNKKLLNFFKNPKIWILFNIIISSAIAFTWVSYQVSSDVKIIDKNQKKITTLENIQHSLTKDLINIKGIEKLPNINKQLDIVELYFKSYNLEFEKQKIDGNGTYYHAVVSGSLVNLLVALQDIEVKKMPLRYKNIAVADDVAALHIIILGSK